MRDLDTLKALISDRPTDPYYLDDCIRICQVVRAHIGVDITVDEAELLWEEISDRYSASWLILGTDEEIVGMIKDYCST